MPRGPFWTRSLHLFKLLGPQLKLGLRSTSSSEVLRPTEMENLLRWCRSCLFPCQNDLLSAREGDFSECPSGLVGCRHVRPPPVARDCFPSHPNLGRVGLKQTSATPISRLFGSRASGQAVRTSKLTLRISHVTSATYVWREIARDERLQWCPFALAGPEKPQKRRSGRKGLGAARNSAFDSDGTEPKRRWRPLDGLKAPFKGTAFCSETR